MGSGRKAGGNYFRNSKKDLRLVILDCLPAGDRPKGGENRFLIDDYRFNYGN